MKVNDYINRDKHFYLVYRPPATIPISKPYETFTEAREEAERLAFKYPGNVFLILKAVGFSQALISPAMTKELTSYS